MLVDGIPVAELIYNENVKTDSMIEISTGVLENLYSILGSSLLDNTKFLSCFRVNN